ncbi:response regulator transcription factor [Shewanella putrefaciens]|uniref:Response regulator transcription factor n=1 Tax=Shewanella putrefaciens TaxID=24 RepID=A0ABX8XCD1_SHEPU|nr:MULTISPECIES: response regulator transcription factor [Shewanella]ABM22968.1 two component transcriptional regulator, winged helix family [Shewanella sp. W3-18-1]AVV84402.1 XRE family transcriptional regulator [Shewanella putrefaciens]MCK7634871.1 response regulator transcription factor [Shewanella sp. JNE17]MCK7650096.1 response regulator transcription factor [Shewanella sp. JNE8]MCK7658235.1 response regulator transcription factor [Shewanella sp. JNE4-2]
MLVLLVEDNRLLSNNIIQYLELSGIECDYAFNLAQADMLISQQQFDAIILDLNLPDGDGIEACERWKAQCFTSPIIMLTARSSLNERLAGFAVGADDYLIKPFAMEELVARLKVVAQRRPAPQRLIIGDLEIDFANHMVYRQGQLLVLSKTGWQILALLARRSPETVSREEIERMLWPDSAPDSDSLRSHIHLLRRVIDRPFERQILHTIRGVGLSLRDEINASA